jgi:hypothetical protein
VKDWYSAYLFSFSGNEKLHKMTEQNPYILRIELEDFENENRYAEYQSFTVGKAESKYRPLSIFRPNITEIFLECTLTTVHLPVRYS